MDGPYLVEVSLSPAKILHFRALKRNLIEFEELAVGENVAAPFIRDLISQMRELLTACKRQNFWSSDTEALESSIASLEADVRKLDPL